MKIIVNLQRRVADDGEIYYTRDVQCALCGTMLYQQVKHHNNKRFHAVEGGVYTFSPDSWVFCPKCGESLGDNNVPKADTLLN